MHGAGVENLTGGSILPTLRQLAPLGVDILVNRRHNDFMYSTHEETGVGKNRMIMFLQNVAS